MAITHLKIEQASTGENVSAALIEKLAEVARGNLDAESNLSGVLNANKAYRDSCEFLVNKFSPNLGINVPQGNYYLRFTDHEAERVLKSAFGDGVGVTEGEASALTNLNNALANNTDIVTFDELKKFTNITTLFNEPGWPWQTYGEFRGCTKLKSIDATNIQVIGGGFQGCSSLEEIKNFSGYAIARYQMYSDAFYMLSTFTKINLSSCQYIGGGAFYRCTGLSNVGSLSNVIAMGDKVFIRCASLAIDVNMPNYGNLPSSPEFMRNEDIANFQKYYKVWFSYSGIRSIQDLGSVCTEIADGYQTLEGYWNLGFASYCNNLRYVILPSQLTYIGTYAFNGDGALEYIKVLASTPPTIGETDTSKAAYPFNDTTCKFYVPNGTISAYQAASGWDALCQAGRVFEMSQFATDFPND